MKLDAVTLPIEPRTVGSCIDLAVALYRTHSIGILWLNLLFGAPAILGAYWLTKTSEWGWLWSGLLFLLLSPFLGAALVAGAGHRVFGEPFEVGNAVRISASRWPSLAFLVGGSRLLLVAFSFVCLGFPVAPMAVAVRFGFLPEILVLERLSVSAADRRMLELLRYSYWKTMGRGLAVGCFAAALSLDLFTLIDVGSQTLFGHPLFLGRVSWMQFPEESLQLLLGDPGVVAAWSLSLWLIYPLARLAWFLCYLDTRIRKEGWDLEIAFRLEAQRLSRS